jgi:hypothetical protein
VQKIGLLRSVRIFRGFLGEIFGVFRVARS